MTSFPTHCHFQPASRQASTGGLLMEGWGMGQWPAGWLGVGFPGCLGVRAARRLGASSPPSTLHR